MRTPRSKRTRVGIAVLAASSALVGWTTLGTQMRAADIIELRTAVNDKRDGCGLAPVSWTDASISSGSPIKTEHVEELRVAISAVYVSQGASVPAFTDPTLQKKRTVIQLQHVTELRNAVDGIPCAMPSPSPSPSPSPPPCPGTVNVKLSVPRPTPCRKGRTTGSYTICASGLDPAATYYVLSDIRVRKQAYCRTVYCPFNVTADADGNLAASSTCSWSVPGGLDGTLQTTWPNKFFNSGDSLNGWYNIKVYKRP